MMFNSDQIPNLAQALERPSEQLCCGILLTKSSEEDGVWKFSGIASDESEDVQGDVILKKSLDLTYANNRGFVNWDHSKFPEDQIGFLRKAEVIGPARLKELQKGLNFKLSNSASVFVEGELYQHVPRAAAVHQILKSTPGDVPGLGLSLQGQVARESETSSVVKAFVRGIAITPAPAHPNTLCKLLKSLSSLSKGEILPSELTEAEQELLRKSTESKGLNFDEATLWLLKQRPNWTYNLATKVVNLTISRKK